MEYEPTPTATPTATEVHEPSLTVESDFGVEDGTLYIDGSVTNDREYPVSFSASGAVYYVDCPEDDDPDVDFHISPHRSVTLCGGASWSPPDPWSADTDHFECDIDPAIIHINSLERVDDC